MQRLFSVLAAFLILLFSAGSAFASTHTVSRGESLYSISRLYGTTVAKIKSLNGLRGDIIYPGQKLTVPDRLTKYTVRRGDNLTTIGKKFGVTAAAIQRANGLKTTVIRPGQVLVIPIAAPNSAATRGFTVSRADIDLLARLITAEADDQSYLVKVAVGAVVLNRVASPKFPNTIAGVIYDWSHGKVQFEPVLNGWINRPASPEAIRAAKDALNGRDPTGGALYFFEPWVKNRFLHSLPLKLVMGAFHFA
ncbi:LysM peptidoglycan-binding domain-containing protein [Desulforudis sp. 1088]|uniref:cell wall hydrolase n=1 Tax=unclassified Candidatus Desulforudis TaxID=2635950 RepID=UPI00348418D2